MSKVDLRDIKTVCEQFNNDPLKIEAKIKSVQSKKCRFKKMKKADNYDQEMQKLLDYEQVLKEAKASLVPKEKFVTQYEQADVEKLDYDQTRKALKSIQSKKCLELQYDRIEEVEKAEKIESMLKEHLKEVKPVDEMYVRKTDVQTIIETIENDPTISTELILKHLKSLVD